MASVDPVTFSVMWGGLISTAADMGTALLRTAYSMSVREGSDFSTGVFDAAGNMVAQGDYSPGHLGAMAFTVREVLSYYPKESLQPGDAIICNDPTIGAGHLPDMFMVTPAFHDGEIVAFVVNIAHHMDIGGIAPGGEQIVGVRETYQEGLRLLPVKLFAGGEPVAEIFRVVEGNVRLSKAVLGDLRGQYAANQIGVERIKVLAGRYGNALFASCMAQIIQQSRDSMRNAIASLSQGVYKAKQHLDDVGPGTEPVDLVLTLTVADGRILCDWTGTGPQREAGLNPYLQYTRSYCIAAIKSVTLPAAPQNFGIISCIDVAAPEGCYVNPRPGAASGARSLNAGRIYDVVMSALSQIVPTRVIAASSGNLSPKLSGFSDSGQGSFLANLSFSGGVGARHDHDGQESTSSPTNSTNVPVEVQEMTAAVLVERLHLIPDTGGAGRYRGGMGVRKDVRLLSDRGRITNVGDRQIFAPEGIFGGHPGATARIVLNPDTPQAMDMHLKGIYDIRKGDMISMRTAGAGGFGDPLEREPERVLLDVRLGLISIEAARAVYNVAIAQDPLSLDMDETRKLRGDFAAEAAKPVSVVG